MKTFSKWTIVMAIVTLASLVLWAAHFFPFSYEKFFKVIQGRPDSYVAQLGLAFWSGHFGTTAFFFCGVIGISALVFYHLRGFTKDTKRLAAIALILAASYYALQIPFLPYMLSYTNPPVFFAYSYLIQAIATVPLMLSLAFLLIKKDNRWSTWKISGLTYTGLSIALWANVMMRWSDMLSSDGLAFLLTGIISLGFLDTVIFMSLSIVFAVIASVYFFKNKKSIGLKYIGLSLTFIGVHYIIYMIYSFYVGMLSYVLLVDIWTIPFIALGIALFYENK